MQTEHLQLLNQIFLHISGKRTMNYTEHAVSNIIEMVTQTQTQSDSEFISSSTNKNASDDISNPTKSDVQDDSPPLGGAL